ncbi:MAG: PqqD family protein [Deltaproteobacteria bacterium]|nr:PqqD family protein [Deltaproteobacteria bacterium]MBW2136914.1 PqqD family protein [Deltaproteobacteria bacterium]
MELSGKGLRINPDFVFREEESGALLFNPRTDALHCVNVVGAFICGLCNGKNDLKQIVAKLSEHFDTGADLAAVQKEVEDFITRMIDLNLLVGNE